MPNRRPKLELIAPGASPEEAAAIVAALEQFMRDTAPVPAPAADKPNPWFRAGLWAMELTAVPEPRVRAAIERAGGELLGTLTSPRAGSELIDDRTYLVGR